MKNDDDDMLMSAIIAGIFFCLVVGVMFVVFA